MRFRTVVSAVTLVSVLGAATGPSLAAQSVAGRPSGSRAEAPKRASEGQEAASLQEARRHFGLGVELLQLKTPDYARAHQHFSVAHQLSGSWKVLGNLGLCAFKLERYSEALAHYNAYLREGGDQVSSAEKAAVEQESASIWANSGEVTLTAHGAPQSIEDARKRSGLPAQVYSFPASGSLTLRLHAGRHLLTARTKTGVQVELKVDVVAGEQQTGHFEFEQPFAESRPLPAVSVQASERSWSKTQAWGLGVGAVGAANLLVAMGFGFLALGKDRRGRAQCDFDVETPTCGQQARQDFDDQVQYARTANVLLAVGGVVSLTGLGLIVFGGGGGADSADPADGHAFRAVEISPFTSMGSSGLVVSGQF